MFTIEIFAYKWTLEVQICVVQGSTVSLISVRPSQSDLVIILWFTNFPIMLHLCSSKEGGTELRERKAWLPAKGKAQRRQKAPWLLQSRGARRKVLQFPGAKKRESLLRDTGRKLTAREISHFIFFFFPEFLLYLGKETEGPQLALRGSMSIWDAIRTSHGWDDL